MEIVNRTPLTVGMVGGRVSFPTPSLTIIVKGTFDLRARQPATLSEEQLPPTGDEPYEDGAELAATLRYESDFAYFKPKADLLLVGKAHAPGGDPVPDVPVEFRVGEYGKSLVVFGDRWWTSDIVRSQPSEAVPFSTMELRYENAFGGEGFKANPVGRGHSKVPSAWGYEVWPLPNVEDPAARIESRGDVRFPAGFGPLHRLWDGRSSKVGSYKGGWLRTRWPWFPDDFDWSYFNAARPDMQVEGYLRGDEEVYLENLDPELPRLAARLPGTRVRCFLAEDSAAVARGGDDAAARRDSNVEDESGPAPTGGHRFREVEMRLDTLWVDAQERKLVLVWRGVAKVLSEEHEELRHLLVLSEELDGEPLPLDACRRELEDTLASEAAEAEPVDLDALASEKPPADEAADLTDEAMEAEVVASIEVMNQELAAAGIPTVAYPPDPSSLPTPSPEAPADLQALLKEYGIEDEDEEEPGASSGPLSRQGVEARLKAGESLFEQDLTGADLSGLDLTDADLRRALLVNAILHRTRLDRADLTEANLEQADLTGASLREANLTDADLTRTLLVEADLSGAVLRDASAEGADLRSSRLEAAQAADTILPGANLSGARAGGVVLQGADLTGSVLSGTDLRGADLSEACLEGVTAVETDFSTANLRELQASAGADFSRASFRDAVAVESIWSDSRLTEADLAFATLEGADFTGADLARSSLVGADLRFARLVKASLVEARMIECNLFEASLEKARLDHADLTGASLYGAEVLDARFVEARLDRANLKMTKFDVR